MQRFKAIEAKAHATQRSLTARHVDLKEWRVVFKLLLDQTPQDLSSQADRTIVVRVPENFRSQVVTDSKRLFLNILIQTEVEAQFLLPSDQDDSSRYITLKGLGYCIPRAKQLLLEAYDSVQELKSDEADTILDTSPIARVRSSFTQNARMKAIARNRLLTEIDPPINDMSVFSFSQYVDDLVASRPPRLKIKRHQNQQEAAQKMDSHIDQVADILAALFSTDKLRPCWSLKASKEALSYLGKYRKFLQARQILSSLRAGGGAKVPQIFDTFMQGAAGAQDLKNFQYCLEMMIKQGINPTWRTWLLFARLMIHYDLSIANHITDTMRERHLLDSNLAKSNTVNLLAKSHYENWMDAGGTLQGFFEHYDSLWGSDFGWLNKTALLGLLTYHAHRAQYSEVRHLLNTYHGSGRMFHHAHLEMLLANAKLQGNVEEAVSIFELMASLQPRVLMTMSVDMFRSLSNLTWQRRYISMTGVLWRYACMTGHVDNGMEHTMRRSLSSSPEPSVNLLTLAIEEKEASPSEEASTEGGSDSSQTLVPSRLVSSTFFKKVAGVVAIGLQLGVVEGKSASRSAGKIPAYMTRRERLETMQQDMDTGGRYRPQIPFHTMLRDAYERDQELKRNGLPTNLAALIIAQPQVPVAERRSAISTRGIRAAGNRESFYSSVTDAIKSRPAQLRQTRTRPEDRVDEAGETSTGSKES